MQMQEDVAQHPQRAAARSLVVLDAQDALPDLASAITVASFLAPPSPLPFPFPFPAPFPPPFVCPLVPGVSGMMKILKPG
jgi:hypothetical protein